MDVLAGVRESLARHDWQAAFDQATAVAEAAGVADVPEAAAERADLLADAAWWLGRLDDCIDARELAYRLYDELGDHRRAGQCAVWLYEHHSFRARYAIAGGWLRRARRALEDDTDSAARGAWLLREAEQAHGLGELDRAIELAETVIALGRRLPSADLEAEALQTKGRLLIDRGDVREGMGHLDEAMLFAIEGRLGPYSTGKVYCSLISACEETGDIDRAAEWTEATSRWASRHPFAIFPGICRVHRAQILKRRGSLAEAEREAVRACEELADCHPVNSAAAFAEVGDIHRRLGDLDRSELAFDRASELAGGPCGGLALLRLAQGRTDGALSIITACLRSSSTNRLARASLLPILAHVAIAAGDLDGARAAADELDEIAEVFATPVLRASQRSTRGRLQLAEHDSAAAAATLAEAVGEWQSLEIPYEVATTQTLLGQALRECGDDAAAAEAFEAAARLFDHIGARLDARQVLDDTRSPLPAGLTEREAEVLRHVAAGSTNNEIAEALFLSTKTVSRHLSNIFTKIGVTSRSAATAYAFEHDLVEPRG